MKFEKGRPPLTLDCITLIDDPLFTLIFANMDIQCSDTELQIFEKIAAAAAGLHVPCYLIGGFVREDRKSVV